MVLFGGPALACRGEAGGEPEAVVLDRAPPQAVEDSPALADDEGGERVYYEVSELPRLHIGSVDGGDLSLYVVADAVRLEDGRILVANRGSSELKLFDAEGGLLRSFGGEGEGPGEFRSLHRIAELADGRIAAVDLLLRRVTVFSANGDLDRTYGVTAPPGESWPRTAMHGFFANGSLVALQEVEGEGTETHYGDYPSSALTLRASVVQPVLIDTAGRAVPFGRPMLGDETVSQIEMNMGGGDMTIRGTPSVPVPFLKTAQAAVGGGVVALGHTSEYDVRLYDQEGRLRSFFGGGESREAPPAVREAWVDEWLEGIADPRERKKWRTRYEEILSSSSAPPIMPSFKSLALQRGGNVWVELYDPSLAEADPTHWDVQGSGGPDDRGRVVLPPRFRPHDIGSDYVLGVWRDELGIEFVRVYDLVEVSPGGP